MEEWRTKAEVWCESPEEPTEGVSHQTGAKGLLWQERAAGEPLPQQPDVLPLFRDPNFLLPEPCARPVAIIITQCAGVYIKAKG